MRERKWAILSEKADVQRQSNGGLPTTSGRAQGGNLSRVDEVDPVTEDNQKRLDSLKLQDPSGRRPANHERQGSENSVMSR